MDLQRLEAQLVAMALSGEWTVAEFTRYCRRLPDRIDPDGAEPREAQRAEFRLRRTIQAPLS